MPMTNDSARKVDANGFMNIDNNPISREGVFQYLGKEIGAPEPDRVYDVYRPADELSDPECLDSFKLLPIVDDHTWIGKDGVPAEKKVVHGTTGDNVAFKSGVLYANLKVFSNALAKRIKDGKKDLSIGYKCRYEHSPGTFAGKAYDYIQRSLRGNHLALVDRARSYVSVLDNQRYAFDNLVVETERETVMDEETKKLLAAQDERINKIGDSVAALVKSAADKAEAEKKAADEAALAKADEAKKAADAFKSDEEKEKEKADKEKAGDEALKKALDTIADLTKTVDSLKKDGVKTLLSEIGARDDLARRLAPHIGQFDSRDKTLDEVSAYGVEKLGLKCDKGHERAALDGFLMAAEKSLRPAARLATGANGSAVDLYINQKGE